ncbi:hypothetical protein [Oligella urethralis]|uniref:hypothetical protein n=1 Tax=Oligella urethralis TaxID=90245 RepID=UPI0018CEB56E|nr:hypothetical protein [Oligella urethralis]
MSIKLKKQIKINGKMSEEGADKVSNKLANATLIATCGSILVAALYVIRWW